MRGGGAVLVCSIAALAAPYSALAQSAVDAPAADAVTNLSAELVEVELVTAPLTKAARFPALLAVDARPGEPAGCAIGHNTLLDPAWIARCMGAVAAEPGSGEVLMRFRLARDALGPAIERVNQAYFAQGYVSSGVVAEETGAPAAIRLRLIAGAITGPKSGRACEIDEGAPRLSHRRYARARLAEGCSDGDPFNAYLLERDFRRLADDRNRWIKQVNMNLRPVAGTRGAVTLLPAGAARLVQPRPWIDVAMGAANNRSPSIGSIRTFGAVSLQPLAGLGIDANAGVTDGALDGQATVLVELDPRWTLAVRGDLNEAQVVDPALRPLDIRSRGHGGEVGLYFGAQRCPLTPVFGDPFDRTPRIAVAGDGLLACRVAGRLPGDAPVGWAAANDLTLGIAVAHQRSRSYLLGIPFSFAPGAVDGRSFTTVARGSLDWLARGRIDARGDLGWTLAARLETSVGLDGSATDVAGVAAPSPHFVVVRAQVSYARQIRRPRILVSARLSGQWTDGLLYTSERLPIGGAGSVRGYPEATVLVDRGAIGSIEVSRDIFSGTASGNPREFDPLRFRVSAFVDGAIGRSLLGASRKDVLASVGLGLSWQPRDGIELRLEHGWRIGDEPRLKTGSLADRGFHFGVTVRPLLWFGGSR